MRIPPTTTPLDDVDRAILQLLQRDARNATAVEMAEKIGVSDATIRNRIDELEEQGVIKGYVPLVDYEKAGFPLELRIDCTARIIERGEFAKEILDIEGVVEVTEFMTGRNNIMVTAVAPTHGDLTGIAVELDKLGLEIESETLINHHYFRPFNHFGVTDISGDEDAISEV